MSVLYIKEQGAMVQKKDERIVVTKNQNRLLDVPVFQIENIAVIGNVQISTQALHMLMEKGVDVSYLTYSGRYLGSTAAEASKNIFLRFEQYRFYLDETRRLQMARTIVANKIGNQIEILKAHKRNDPLYDWERDIEQLEKLRVSLPVQVTGNKILGIEGMCSNIYFGAFGHIINGDYRFTGRNRRPPRDPVNVIISLAYTFLTKEVASALDSESFEPYLGFLHGIRYGRKSLSLDIVEEFRQPVVDRLVIILFNKRMIGRYDFEFPGEDRVVLTEDGFRKFCAEYEKWITGRNSLSGARSFRSIIREQVSALKKAIRENKEYEPYSWRDRNVCDQL